LACLSWFDSLRKTTKTPDHTSPALSLNRNFAFGSLVQEMLLLAKHSRNHKQRILYDAAAACDAHNSEQNAA
jgi:hypothetical protein